MFKFLSWFIINEEKSVDGFMKAHLHCGDHVQEFTTDFFNFHEYLYIRCEKCNIGVYYQATGAVFDDPQHVIKKFSSNYKLKG